MKMASGFPDPRIATKFQHGRWWVVVKHPDEDALVVSREVKEAAECIAQKMREACEDHRDDVHKASRG